MKMLYTEERKLLEKFSSTHYTSNENRTLLRGGPFLRTVFPICTRCKFGLGGGGGGGGAGGTGGKSGENRESERMW